MMAGNGAQTRGTRVEGAMSETSPGHAEEPASTTGPGIDAVLMGQLARLLAESDLAELEIEKGDLRVRMVRSSPVPMIVAAPAPPITAPLVTTVVAAPSMPLAAATLAATEPDHPGTLKSPMVGTAYRRQNPESKPFVEIGSVVKAGERVLLVEAMKTFNEILAPRAGSVVAIFIEDGQPVEYGEPLLVIA